MCSCRVTPSASGLGGLRPYDVLYYSPWKRTERVYKPIEVDAGKEVDNVDLLSVGVSIPESLFEREDRARNPSLPCVLVRKRLVDGPQHVRSDLLSGSCEGAETDQTAAFAILGSGGPQHRLRQRRKQIERTR